MCKCVNARFGGGIHYGGVAASRFTLFCIVWRFCGAALLIYVYEFVRIRDDFLSQNLEKTFIGQSSMTLTLVQSASKMH